LIKFLAHFKAREKQVTQQLHDNLGDVPSFVQVVEHVFEDYPDLFASETVKDW
jgi:hypothetical protein